MITLNDYLYSGDTILRILHNYIHDLRAEAKKTHNEVDMIHCNFLILIRELLEHNDFLDVYKRQHHRRCSGEERYLFNARESDAGYR